MEHSTYPPAAAAHSRSGSLAGMENNFKKAITELLVLFLSLIHISPSGSMAVNSSDRQINLCISEEI